MSLGIIAVLLVVLAVVAAVGFFVLKRMLRWAVRLALLGAAVVLLLAGAVVWWWYAPPEESPSPRGRQGNAAARPANRSR